MTILRCPNQQVNSCPRDEHAAIDRNHLDNNTVHVTQLTVQSGRAYTWSSPQVLQVDKYLFFIYEYLIDKLCIWSKLIHSTLTLPQLLQMNLHHMVMMTSQRHHIKKCLTEIMVPEKENFQFHVFICMKLGDGPMKIHRELESVYGTRYSYMTLFAGGSDVFKAEERHQ